MKDGAHFVKVVRVYIMQYEVGSYHMLRNFLKLTGFECYSLIRMDFHTLSKVA